MSQPFVTTDIHESLDIHGHLAAQATFDLIAGFDDGAQAVDLVFSQTVYAHLWIDTSPAQPHDAGNPEPQPVD